MKELEHINFEIAIEQLTYEEQVNFINLLVHKIAKEKGLDYKTAFTRLSKGKPLSISASEQRKKDALDLERVRKEGKYLADLIENSNLVNEDDKSTANNCAFHNKYDSTTRSSLSTCRRKLKKLCALYGIEYDLKQFREIEDERTML